MSGNAESDSGNFRVPNGLNLIIMSVAIAVALGSLYLAAHATSFWLVLLVALIFSYVNNTLFSLLHESVHGVFHSNRRVNVMAGLLCAAFFPTSFSIQRAFHRNHHKHNRSEHEQFDYIRPGDSRLVKYAQWYSILTGLYWVFSPLFSLLYVLMPGVFHRVWQGRQSGFAFQTSATSYLESVRALNINRLRLEVLSVVVFQLFVFWLLDLSITSWLLCYALFAINWSALQYADHAFSPLDRTQGAWNLKVNPLVRLLFLNYHFHYSHHLQPNVPWYYLPQLKSSSTQLISFVRVYWEMWKGPKPIEHAGAGVSSPGQVSDAINAWRPKQLTVMAIIFATVFGLVYIGADAISSQAQTRWAVAYEFEQSIPFIPLFSLFYISIIPLLFTNLFVFRNGLNLFPLFVTLCVQVVIAGVVFVLLPIERSFPAHEVSGLSGVFYSIATTINLTHNDLPSLHVALTTMTCLAIARVVTGIRRWAMLIWGLLVVLSTLLIHEHHVLDVVSGLALVAITWFAVYRPLSRPGRRQSLRIEWECLRNIVTYARRHLRYLIIGLILYQVSLFRWRKKRVLRTGFCLLQTIDDYLDGDRETRRDPETLARAVITRMTQGEKVSASPDTRNSVTTESVNSENLNSESVNEFASLNLLTDAIRSDLAYSAQNASEARQDIVALIEHMIVDYQRSQNRAIWTAAQLREHHRKTFTLSMNLLLNAEGSPYRVNEFSELLDAFAWCSTMRDLQEDLEHGLINVPTEVMAKVDSDCTQTFAVLESHPEIRHWMNAEAGFAWENLQLARQLASNLRDPVARKVVGLFVKSMMRFAQKFKLRRKTNRVFG